jgi:hypothetical protein
MVDSLAGSRRPLGYSGQHFENHSELINTICRQNADFLDVKAGGVYSYLT